MKRIFLLLAALVFLVGCSKAGTEGGKCLEENTCAEIDLTCSLQGKCERCGDSSEPCCENKSCSEGLTCAEWGYCQSCGGLVQPCCEGQVCSEDLVCGGENTCEFCGSEGDPCCEGSVCNVFQVCGPDEVCMSCGKKGEPCCEHDDFRGCIEGACIAENTCQTEVCDKNNICTECGINGQPCCEGGTCGSGYICSDDNSCESCGYRGYPICADGACEGWWQEINGVCENPFEIDPQALTSICEQAQPGHNRSQQDWCYWYAAFYKPDVSICDLIQWETMKEKCLEMEDPDDYSIVYF